MNMAEVKQRFKEIDAEHPRVMGANDDNLDESSGVEYEKKVAVIQGMYQKQPGECNAIDDFGQIVDEVEADEGLYLADMVTFDGELWVLRPEHRTSGTEKARLAREYADAEKKRREDAVAARKNMQEKFNTAVVKQLRG